MKNPSVQKEMDHQVKLFLQDRDCTFPGWAKLKDEYKHGLANLPPGCTPCQKNALKRKFASKIKTVFENMDELITQRHGEGN
jgi:hypothetical protein